jgi:predicted permease
LYVLLAMVALILAIACANIANLLLARATARRGEMAVRLSIGAGRLRLIRQLLTESVLLASIGGAVGVVIAIWGIRFLTLLLANGNPDFTLHPDLNWHVLGAAVALSLVTGLLFGLAPALQSTRVDLMAALKRTRAGQPGSHRSFPRASLSQMLVVTQIGLSLLMLVAAGLFVRTLSNLQSIQLGFNRDNVLLFRMNARQVGHQDPEIITFYSDLQKRFSAIPGVRGATASDTPLLGEGTSSGPLLPVGAQPTPGKNPHILMTGADFFTTMQIPVLLGRGIDERDQAGSPAVAVVSEAYVKTYFGDRNPLGQHLSLRRRPPGFSAQEVEIVGVAGNARYGAIKGEFREIVYLPFNQLSYRPVDEMPFALRTSGDPLGYIHTVREIVRQADSRIPVTNVQTQAAQIDQTMSQEIIFARLCTAFAVLALLIASVGLYGTMSYTVAQRTGEIGIRMALGAQRGKVIWMVLRQVFVLAIAGLAIGVPTALGTSRFVESFLFDVEPNSPASLAGAVAILLSAVLLAGYVPARKASRIDPMTAVRHE